MPKVVRKFKTADGRVLEEKDLTPEQRRAFAHKIMDILIVPLAYESVMRDLEKQRKTLK